jgi:hypothetical protein
MTRHAQTHVYISADATSADATSATRPLNDGRRNKGLASILQKELA